jgi:hypothetical protein
MLNDTIYDIGYFKYVKFKQSNNTIISCWNTHLWNDHSEHGHYKIDCNNLKNT